MDFSPVTADELRHAQLPSARNGRDPAAVTELLERAAATIDSLHRQVGELHQTVAVLRADSAEIEIARRPDTPAAEVFADWLAGLDPVELHRHVEVAIAEALVESTVAAQRIRHETIERTRVFVDTVAAEAAGLDELLGRAQGSVAAMNDLPQDIAGWRGRFHGTLARGLEQLQLPWGTEVSQVAQLLARMHQQVPQLPTSPQPGPPSAPPWSATEPGSLADTPVWGS